MLAFDLVNMDYGNSLRLVVIGLRLHSLLLLFNNNGSWRRFPFNKGQMRWMRVDFKKFSTLANQKKMENTGLTL